MTTAAPGQSATGRAAAAPLMSFPRTSPAPRETSNLSGEAEQSTESGFFRLVSKMKLWKLFEQKKKITFYPLMH